MALRPRPAKLVRGATTPSIVQMTRDLTSFAALMVVMFLVAAAIGVVFGRYSATKSPTSIRLRQLRYEEYPEQLHGVDLNQGTGAPRCLKSERL